MKTDERIGPYFALCNYTFIYRIIYRAVPSSRETRAALRFYVTRLLLDQFRLARIAEEVDF